MDQYTVPAIVPPATSGNLSDLVADRAANEPSRITLSRPLGDGWQGVTAKEFDAQVREVAKGLMAANIGVGHGQPEGQAQRHAGQMLGDRQGGLRTVAKGPAHMTARAPPLPGLNPVPQQMLSHRHAGPLSQRHDTDTRDPICAPALLKLHAGQRGQRRAIELPARHPLAPIRRPAIQRRHPHRTGKLTKLGIGRDHFGLAIAKEAKAGHLPHPRN